MSSSSGSSTEVDVTVITSLEQQKKQAITKEMDQNEKFFDENLVSFSQDDPESPRNWPNQKKVAITSISCMMALITMMSVSIMTPAIPDIVYIFRTNNTIGALTYSLFVSGWCIAPMVFAPLSEIIGRRWLYVTSWVGFMLGFVACALAPDMKSLLGFRFAAGFIGAPAITLNAGTVVDLWSVEQQGMAVGIVVIVSYLGPLLGPIVGGYIAQYHSWRWTLWATVIMAGAFLPFVLWMPETHAPTLLRRKVRAIREKTGNRNLYVEGEKIVNRAFIMTALALPLRLLFTELVIFLVAVYISVVTAILYLYFGAYPWVFRRTYLLSKGDSSLAFIGLAVGCLLAAPTAKLMTNYYMKRRIAKNGVGTPENRLPFAIGAAIVAPISIFWFAWSGRAGTHWIVPVLSGVPFGWATLVLFIALYTYVADGYMHVASQVFAGVVFMRSLMTAAFPIFMPTMYENLGAPWATSILGFLTLGLAPIPFFFYKYGALVRAKSKYAIDH